MDACQPNLNDETTEQQDRTVQKYCHFIPRRLGIIALASIKLVLSLGLLEILWDGLLLLYIIGDPIWFYIIITWITIALDVVDVVIALIVIISVCAKNQRIMKMYYKCSIYVFGALFFLCCVFVFTTTTNVVVLLIFLLVFFSVLMMQEYLNRLLKREVLKLESSEQICL